MTGSRQHIADVAMQMVGTRYRLRGRKCDTGLDCVGVVLVALHRCGIEHGDVAPYHLRNRSIARQLEAANADTWMHLDGSAPICAGDILLCRCGPAQHHLLIATGPDGFVHAHAGLRRVVSQPGPLPWPVTAIFRIREKD